MSRLAVLVLVFLLVGCVGDVPISTCQTGDCDAGPDAVGVQKDGDTADMGSDVNAIDSGNDTSVQDAGADSVADSGPDGSCTLDAAPCNGRDCVNDGCGGIHTCNMCNGIKFNNILEQQCALAIGDGGTNLLDSGLTTQSTDFPGFCTYIIINPNFSCVRDSSNDFRCGPSHPYAWSGCSSTPAGCAVQQGSTCCP